MRPAANLKLRLALAPACASRRPACVTKWSWPATVGAEGRPRGLRARRPPARPAETGARRLDRPSAAAAYHCLWANIQIWTHKFRADSAGRTGGEAARRQGGKVARWQGGKAAGRQGGRAAGRQGGRAARRKKPRLLSAARFYSAQASSKGTLSPARPPARVSLSARRRRQRQRCRSARPPASERRPSN